MAAEENNKPLPPAGEPVVSAADGSPSSQAGDPYTPYDDPYGYGGTEPYTGGAVETSVPATIPAAPAPPPAPPPSASSDSDDEDDDDEGMLRMSFLEHLEELRSRILRALAGLAIAFLLSLTFSETLWSIVQEPAAAALQSLGYKDTGLIFTSPMESFSIIWIKLPLLTALFLASPWLLYQVWGFVAPGLYRKERRLAGPFILCSAGLFVLGGLFGYFVAFRFGLTFLLGIGRDVGVRPMITISEYFDIFVNVILGISVVFELPVLIFFLTLLRITSARFLLRHSRYAILAIVMVAAVITPTPDVFNLMIFSIPMVLLYFIGIFSGYLLELSRENKRFPWAKLALILLVTVLLGAAGVALAVVRYGYHPVGHWPFLVR
jgi:sec-independent protein translocase protein TatC